MYIQDGDTWTPWPNCVCSTDPIAPLATPTRYLRVTAPEDTHISLLPRGRRALSYTTTVTSTVLEPVVGYSAAVFLSVVGAHIAGKCLQHEAKLGKQLLVFLF